MSDTDVQNPAEGSSEKETQSEEGKTAVAVAEPAGSSGSEEEKDEGADQAVSPEAGAEEEEEKEKPIPYELVSSETKQGSVLHLQLKVAYEHYLAKSNETFEELQKETIVDGFRKGKAPLNLIRARYARDVKKDAIASIQANVLRQYIEKESPQVLSDPDFKGIEELKEGEPFLIDVSMEVRPRLSIVEYGDLKVEVESREVTDKDVDAELENLRWGHVSYKTKEDGVVTEADALVLDIGVKDDRGREIPRLSRSGVQVVNFQEHLPKPVCEALVGKKAGETVEAAVESERRNRADAIVSANDHYAVTIKEIQETELPELNDEFAKDVGEFATLEDLKKDVRKRLEEIEENRRRGAAIRAICDDLLVKNPFDAPPSLVVSSASRSMQDEYYQMLQLGEDIRRLTNEDRDVMLERHKESAASVVRRMILIEEIGRIEKIEATDADLDKEIERMAEQQGRRPLAIRAQLEAQKRLDSARANLRDQKIADFLLAKAQIAYKPAVQA